MGISVEWPAHLPLVGGGGVSAIIEKLPHARKDFKITSSIRERR